MNDRIEEIFQQVINEDCPDPLRRFADLVAAEERNKFCTFLMQLHKQYKHQHNHFHVAAVNMWEEACGGRCNAENNPCEYKEAALELEGLKPVAWRKKVNGVWHYFDESTPFPFDDCEPLYEKN